MFKQVIIQEMRGLFSGFHKLEGMTTLFTRWNLMQTIIACCPIWTLANRAKFYWSVFKNFKTLCIHRGYHHRIRMNMLLTKIRICYWFIWSEIRNGKLVKLYEMMLCTIDHIFTCRCWFHCRLEDCNLCKDPIYGGENTTFLGQNKHPKTAIIRLTRQTKWACDFLLPPSKIFVFPAAPTCSTAWYNRRRPIYLPPEPRKKLFPAPVFTTAEILFRRLGPSGVEGRGHVWSEPWTEQKHRKGLLLT